MKRKDAKKQRYWQRTIGGAARSGMSIREFCRRRHVKGSQFCWRQRQLKADGQEPTMAPGGDEEQVLP